MRLRLLSEPAASRREAATVAEHARRLRDDHGFEVVEGDGEGDVALATGPEGAALLVDSPARVRAWLVQDADRPAQPGRQPTPWATAAQTIAGTRWIADRIAALRGVAPPLVRPGADKAQPAPPGRAPVNLDEPLRVLVVADEATGWEDAVRATTGMTEPRVVTLLQDGATVKDASADRIVGPLTAAEKAALLRRHDVVVRMARHEALPHVVLEAFHAGATCVTLPATGHDEVVTHGFNGWVSSFDDDRGAARALDLLARDRRLLAYLRENAVATARAWPSWTQATAMLALVLRRLASAAC